MRLFDLNVCGMAIATLLACPLLSGDSYTRSYPFQNSNESSVKESFGSGLYGKVKERPEIEESVMLNNLDKEGRRAYYSLDHEGKRLARQLAAEAANMGFEQDEVLFKSAVDEAHAMITEKIMQQQDRRLHNGMDRLSEKRNGM